MKFESILTHEEKISEYIEKLNNGYIPKNKDLKESFSDNTPINYFFQNNNRRIIKELKNNPKYKEGYDIAKQTITTYIDNYNKQGNRYLVKELCLRYDIDTKKYKSILNKSYDEVYSKICYLQDNNLSIIENNNLHEIFFISDINLKTIYNISLEELINTYINKDNRIKKLCL